MEDIFSLYFQRQLVVYVSYCTPIYKNAGQRIVFTGIRHKGFMSHNRVDFLKTYYAPFQLLAPSMPLVSHAYGLNNEWLKPENKAFFQQLVSHKVAGSCGNTLGTLYVMQLLIHDMFNEADLLYTALQTQHLWARTRYNHTLWDSLFYLGKVKALDWLFQKSELTSSILKRDSIIFMAHQCPMNVFKWVADKYFDDNFDIDADIFQDAIEQERKDLMKWYISGFGQEMLDLLCIGRVWVFNSMTQILFVAECLAENGISPSPFLIAAYRFSNSWNPSNAIGVINIARRFQLYDFLERVDRLEI